MERHSKRSSNLDPLDLLKEFTIAKKNIKQKDQYLYFDSQKFKLNTETCFRGSSSKTQYTLGSLWLFLENHKNKYVFKEYREKSEKLDIKTVTKIDQQDIIKYFTGEVDFTDCIDLDLKQQLMNKKISGKEAVLMQPFPQQLQQQLYQQRQGEQDSTLNGQEPSKKLKTNAEEDKTVVQLNPQEEQLAMMRWLAQVEKPLTSKTRMLRSQNNKKFSHLLKYLHNLAQGGRQQSSRGYDASINLPNCILKTVYQTKKKPVIVVPPTHQPGNISLRNFKQLFKDGVYENPATTSFRCPEGRLDIEKDINGHRIVFEVVDNVGSIKQKNEWDRIVAIFMTGSKYQFNMWPDGDKNAIFFNKKRGFFIHYSTVPPNDFVKSCNYKNLELQESNRGNDKMVRDAFWKDLEAFLIKPIY